MCRNTIPAGDPEADSTRRFMSSEADLDTDIKSLSILSEHSDLYPEFAKLGCAASLVSLLSHENTDIAIDAIEIIDELIDEDVEAEQSHWDALVDALLEADLLALLRENLTRLDEGNESDRAGVYHILSILENLSSRTAIAASIGKGTTFLPWLLSRIKVSETTVSQNQEYSTEILNIFLQASADNRHQIISLDGVDLFLQLLSPYRKRDPEKGSDEEEFVENLFDCAACCLDESEGKAKFVEAEGVELCLIMLREGKMSKERAMNLLDHALGGPDGRPSCEKLVEAAGLKALFSALMKNFHQNTTGHILGVLSSMLRLLPANEAPRIRLLAKFVERDYHALNRLVQIRREYAAKIATADGKINAEKADLSSEESPDDYADQWLSQRLDAGLYILQTVDIVLAWLIAEDDGAQSRIRSLLEARGESFKALRSTLQGKSISHPIVAPD